MVPVELGKLAVGLQRVIAKLTFHNVAVRVRGYWLGWYERDLVSLCKTLDDPMAYSGGIVKLSKRQYRALRNAIDASR